MAFRSARLLLALWSLSLAAATAAWADPAAPPHAVDPGSAEGAAIIRPAGEALDVALGKPVTLDVKQLNVSGDWAFVYGALRGADGGPIDYAGTPYAEAAANHAKSRSYAALLRRDANTWALTDQAVGATDPTWQAWPSQYGVPAALVEVPAN